MQPDSCTKLYWDIKLFPELDTNVTDHSIHNNSDVSCSAWQQQLLRSLSVCDLNFTFAHGLFFLFFSGNCERMPFVQDAQAAKIVMTVYKSGQRIVFAILNSLLTYRMAFQFHMLSPYNISKTCGALQSKALPAKHKDVHLPSFWNINMLVFCFLI